MTPNHEHPDHLEDGDWGPKVGAGVDEVPGFSPDDFEAEHQRAAAQEEQANQGE